jgi:hypothetical protein
LYNRLALWQHPKLTNFLKWGSAVAETKPKPNLTKQDSLQDCLTDKKNLPDANRPADKTRLKRARTIAETVTPILATRHDRKPTLPATRTLANQNLCQPTP